MAGLAVPEKVKLDLGGVWEGVLRVVRGIDVILHNIHYAQLRRLRRLAGMLRAFLRSLMLGACPDKAKIRTFDP